MSTLQVANLHFESTGNNRIQYNGSNSFSLYAGGSELLSSNASVVTGQIGPKLLQTVTVSSIASDNLTFSSINTYSYSNYLVIFSGVSSNSTSDTRWRGSISTDGVTYTTTSTNITDNARIDRFLDGIIDISVTRLTSNLAICKFSGLTGISGGATGTTDVSSTTVVYGSNNVSNIRLYSADAGRGFGTAGTIYFYGYNKIV